MPKKLEYFGVYFIPIFVASGPLIGIFSEVKQTQIYDARLCTSNQENNSQTKNKLLKQLVRSVGCRYGVQRGIEHLPLNQSRFKKRVDFVY